MKSLIQKKHLSIISWCLYDWANSAYFAVVTTFIFSAYFTRQIAIDPIIGTYQWGKTIAFAGLCVALISPVFGAIADYSGKRKSWLFVFTFLGIMSTALLWFAYPSPNYLFLTLSLIVLSTIGFEIAIVFYNSLLSSVAPKNYLGRISGWAWGLGYAGGLTCLILLLNGIVMREPFWLNIASAEHIRICGPLIALWILVFGLPLFLFVPEKKYANLSLLPAIKFGIRELKTTLISLPQHRSILLFLISRLFYIDGLNTLFAFGGIYAANTFGMSIAEVMTFGILLNVTAGIGAALFAWVDDYLGAKITILISIVMLILLGALVLSLQTSYWFWIWAPLLGIFVGPIQAASRSFMVRLAPKEKITEMFGLYAFSGKATAFIGPWLVAQTTLFFQNQRIGMTIIFLFLLIGGVILSFVKERKDHT